MLSCKEDSCMVTMPVFMMLYSIWSCSIRAGQTTFDGSNLNTLPTAFLNNSSIQYKALVGAGLSMIIRSVFVTLGRIWSGPMMAGWRICGRTALNTLPTIFLHRLKDTPRLPFYYINVSLHDPMSGLTLSDQSQKNSIILDDSCIRCCNQIPPTNRKKKAK